MPSVSVDVVVDGLLLGQRADELVDREGFSRQALKTARGQSARNHRGDRAVGVVLRDARKRLDLRARNCVRLGCRTSSHARLFRASGAGFVKVAGIRRGEQGLRRWWRRQREP
eukprot:1240205-Pleurochrysis_carterae.AAC.1